MHVGLIQFAEALPLLSFCVLAPCQKPQALAAQPRSTQIGTSKGRRLWSTSPSMSGEGRDVQGTQSLTSGVAVGTEVQHRTAARTRLLAEGDSEFAVCKHGCCFSIYTHIYTCGYVYIHIGTCNYIYMQNIRVYACMNTYSYINTRAHGGTYT